MTTKWKTTHLKTIDQILRTFAELGGKRWLFRGQSELHNNLLPMIDRGRGQKLSRIEKLNRERRSIRLFRSTAHYFASHGEEEALTDDISALLVLRHFGAPTRILDWSQSPWVAAYFAAEDHSGEDGEIWAFDKPLYGSKGKKQWKKWPETTTDRSGDPDRFDAKLTAFAEKIPREYWFICIFYGPGFPRQNAQEGAYSMTAHFGVDHADAIANLLGQRSHCRRYILDKSVKPAVLKTLRDQYGIWRGALFPDSAGAAGTVKCRIFPDWQRGGLHERSATCS